MPDARVRDRAFTLLFFLLSSLQLVSASQVIFKCDSISCSKGFRCCDSGCCPEKKTIWDSSNDPLRILFIISLVMIPLLCICGLLKRFCRKCREPERNLRRNHQIPPDVPPPITPIEMIWITSLDPPPPYHQVVLKPIEPPPPYSLSPEDPVGQTRDTDNPAF